MLDFWFLTFIIFLLGMIIGSFLNVVILRFNTGQSIVNDRSKCFSCGSKLDWLNLIPIFSWVFQRGRCQKCSSKISIQYPLVEFFTASLFALTFIKVFSETSFLNLNSLIYLIFLFIIFSILIVIFVYDLKHKIIPNELSYLFAILALINLLIMTPWSNLEIIHYLNLFSGIIFFIPIYLLWKISNGTWIGLGDGKLVLGVGWFLGFIYGTSALILAVWLGAIIAISLMLIERLKFGSQNITMKSEIPFGPFIVVSVILMYFLRIDFIGLNFFF